MITLTEAQTASIQQVWKTYLADGARYVYPVTGFTHQEMDRRRMEVIPGLQRLLDKFFYGSVTIAELKSSVDEITRAHLLWGFQGVNGQVFFNAITTTSMTTRMDDDLNYLFKETLPTPVNLDFAVNNIRTFINYTRSLSVDPADQRDAIKLSSIPYFLSFFWQLQKPETWPIYYKAMVDELQALEIWAPSANLANNYSEFCQLIDHMRDLIESDTGHKLHPWDIEHAFWDSATRRANPPATPAPALLTPQPPTETKPARRELKPGTHKPVRKVLPPADAAPISESYIPPVVAALPSLAAGDDKAAALSRQSGKAITTLFAERLLILFAMLGYETRPPGQGHGDLAGGIAICKEHHYAILMDARVSPKAFDLAGEDQALGDYILKTSERLHRQGLRTLYYLVVAGSFDLDHDAAIRALKLATGVNEVLLAETDALLALLERKLRDPAFNPGPGGIQRLLAASGLLTGVAVRAHLKA